MPVGSLYQAHPSDESWSIMYLDNSYALEIGTSRDNILTSTRGGQRGKFVG